MCDDNYVQGPTEIACKAMSKPPHAEGVKLRMFKSKQIVCDYCNVQVPTEIVCDYSDVQVSILLVCDYSDVQVLTEIACDYCDVQDHTQ